MNNIKRAKICVMGRVQGVFFRQETKEEALALDLVGWVKNTENGNVMIMIQGAEEGIKAMIAWTRVGPDRAKIKKVDVEWLEPSDSLVDFKIII
ncbi:MAG: acylphosphatase [Candidatus Berkelbacteria bacterium]|nr:acylphosphatase [Candidatus Berkelbacteria bacterium]